MALEELLYKIDKIRGKAEKVLAASGKEKTEIRRYSDFSSTYAEHSFKIENSNILIEKSTETFSNGAVNYSLRIYLEEKEKPLVSLLRLLGLYGKKDKRILVFCYRDNELKAFKRGDWQKEFESLRI